MSKTPRTGRPCKAPRFKLILQSIEAGKVKHVFAVTSRRNITELLKLLQSVQESQR